MHCDSLQHPHRNNFPPKQHHAIGNDEQGHKRLQQQEWMKPSDKDGENASFTTGGSLSQCLYQSVGLCPMLRYSNKASSERF